MNKINWAKIGILGGLVATGAGGVLGAVLNDAQADQVVAWAETSKVALGALAGAVGMFVAALLGARGSRQ